MSNERLRAAIQTAGLQPEQLADEVKVDIKTVQRWLAGRTPYPRHRTRVARALGCEQHDLWPELADQGDQEDQGGEPGETLTAYTHLDHPDAPDWRELIENATREVDLLDLTLQHLLEDGSLPGLLADRADAGCRIRVLISHPESVHLAVTEAEQQLDYPIVREPELARHVEHALGLLAATRNHHRIEVRTFIAPPYSSIIRADHQILLAPHLWATPTPQAPVIHLERQQQPGLFKRAAAHYDAVWNTAQPTPR